MLLRQVPKYACALMNSSKRMGDEHLTHAQRAEQHRSVDSHATSANGTERTEWVRQEVRCERGADVPRSRPGDVQYLLVICRTTRIEHYIRIMHRGLEAAVPDTRVV